MPAGEIIFLISDRSCFLSRVRVTATGRIPTVMIGVWDESESARETREESLTAETRGSLDERDYARAVTDPGQR